MLKMTWPATSSSHLTHACSHSLEANWEAEQAARLVRQCDFFSAHERLKAALLALQVRRHPPASHPHGRADRFITRCICLRMLRIASSI